MEEGKSSRAHPHFVLDSSPFRLPFPAPSLPIPQVPQTITNGSSKREESF